MKVLDLFAGIGGFHIAAKEAIGKPFELVGYSEIDPLCKKIYNRNFNISSTLPNGDVRTLATNSDNSWEVDRFDLCLAGFPCQPFSNVGKRRGFTDERSNVFYDIIRVLREYNPKYFVLENVEKIRTIQNGKVLNHIETELKALGYELHTMFLCAKDYGLPHQRKRMFISGQKKSQSTRHSKILFEPQKVPLENAQYPTTWHLLEREMPLRHIVPYGSRKTIFTKNEKWMGNLDIDRKIARPLCATMGKWHRANQDNYFTEKYIMSKDGSKPKNFDFLRDSVRRLTILEALRLQGFPDACYEPYESFKVAPTPGFRTIGNAVPVNMAKAVIKHLID